MTRKLFSVIFMPEVAASEQESAITFKLHAHVPALMVRVLEEAGFFVDVQGAGSLLKVTSWRLASREEIAVRVLEALQIWHGQYCGYSSVYSNSTLHVFTNMPSIGPRAFTAPALDEPLRRIGELYAELDRAKLVQDFIEAARLLDLITHLNEEASQRPV